MRTHEKRPVGRPRKDRVKVGLSMARKSSELLDCLAEMKQQTKSKVVEDAIEYFYKREMKRKQSEDMAR